MDRRLLSRGSIAGLIVFVSGCWRTAHRCRKGGASPSRSPTGLLFSVGYKPAWKLSRISRRVKQPIGIWVCWSKPPNDWRFFLWLVIYRLLRLTWIKVRLFCFNPSSASDQWRTSFYERTGHFPNEVADRRIDNNLPLIFLHPICKPAQSASW